MGCSLNWFLGLQGLLCTWSSCSGTLGEGSSSPMGLVIRWCWALLHFLIEVWTLGTKEIEMYHLQILDELLEILEDFHAERWALRAFSQEVTLFLPSTDSADYYPKVELSTWHSCTLIQFLCLCLPYMGIYNSLLSDWVWFMLQSYIRITCATRGWYCYTVKSSDPNMVGRAVPHFSYSSIINGKMLVGFFLVGRPHPIIQV